MILFMLTMIKNVDL